MGNGVKKPEEISSFKKFKGAAGRFLKRQQAALPSRISSRYGIALVALLLAVITGYHSRTVNLNIRNGIVQSDIIAPIDFSYVDNTATQAAREHEANKVLPVYEYNPAVSREGLSFLNSEWEKLQTQFQEEIVAHNLPPQPDAASPAFTSFVREFASDTGRSRLFREQMVLELLAKRGFSPELQKRLAEIVSDAMAGYVYSSTNLADSLPRRITVRNLETAEQGEVRNIEMVSLFEAHRRLQQRLQDSGLFSAIESEHVYRALKQLVNPNLVYSERFTNMARNLAETRVKPVVVSYKKNQIVARYGETVNQQLIDAVRLLTEKSSWLSRLVRISGYFTLILIVLIALRKFADTSSVRQKLDTSRIFSLICFALVLQTGTIRIGSEFNDHLVTSLGSSSFYIQYQFLVPFAVAALLTAFLLDSVAAQICALVVGLFTGFITDGEMTLVTYSVLSGTAASYAVERYRHRNSITKAGMVIGVVNMLTILMELVINGNTSWQSYMLNIPYGLAGGLLTAGVASLIIPVIESFLDILTDVKLLELSNMDLPLLRDLAINAPGTHQHSLFVSSLAEAAAEAIDANSLLVRVGCYYHDIGKMMAPEMFVENQGGKENPHERMDPKRSASVITGHVRKGILMAQDAGLPQQIIDLIPQHHGTRRLHYFYKKALEQYSTNGEPINEVHYRYPGPKPQTREAAIVMIADCAEASVRSLDDPTPENIRAILKRITEDVIADGQLDECDLTMREYNQVREALIEALCNVYHHRVKYPGFNPPAPEETEGGLPEEPSLTPEVQPQAEKVEVATTGKISSGEFKKKHSKKAHK